ESETQRAWQRIPQSTVSIDEPSTEVEERKIDAAGDADDGGRSDVVKTDAHGPEGENDDSPSAQCADDGGPGSETQENISTMNDRLHEAPARWGWCSDRG